jgi:hypothetical protein
LIDKAGHRKFRAAVEKLLWNDWDPIGLNRQQNWPDDEYSSYAGVGCGMVWNGNDEQAIADYLSKAECQWMGLGGNEAAAVQRNVQLAGKILYLFKGL